MSFPFGFLVNELPLLAVYWLLASTLLLWAQGDFGSPGVWVPIGLAIATAIGLAVVIGRALRTGPVVERALRDGLGANWRDRAGTAHRNLPLARIMLAPFVVRRRDVERVANIEYGRFGAGNLLDLYRPRAGVAGAPVLIHLHGGAFVSGRKDREARPLLYRLASQGWVCVSANYRLRPEARFPDQLVDTKRVIAWVRTQGTGYGTDPARVFIAGSSAGAQLASLAGLTMNDPAYQPGFEAADTSVAGVVSLYGYYGEPDATVENSPLAPLGYVQGDAPPFLVVHGDRDTVLWVEGARQFVDRLRRHSSNPVVYAELPGGQHVFDLFHSIRFERVVDAVEGFAAWVLATRRDGAAPPSGSWRVRVRTWAGKLRVRRTDQ